MKNTFKRIRWLSKNYTSGSVPAIKGKQNTKEGIVSAKKETSPSKIPFEGLPQFQPGKIYFARYCIGIS